MIASHFQPLDVTAMLTWLRQEANHMAKKNHILQSVIFFLTASYTVSGIAPTVYTVTRTPAYHLKSFLTTQKSIYYSLNDRKITKNTLLPTC